MATYRSQLHLTLWCSLAFAGWISTAFGQEPPAVGISKRLPWTTSRVTGSPEPPLPYITEPAFPTLKFNNCLDLACPPNGDRLFVAEQGGAIYSFQYGTANPTADLVIDLAKAIPGAKQLYSLTFHPKFEENRYCYVCYIKDNDKPDGSHIARFRVSDTDPPTIDPKSETTIITWWSGGHNGCSIKFGLDGCLYISTGDGSGPNPPDKLRAGQDVSNLLSSVLRIDVDHPEADKNYRIPPDNPFVNLPEARGEIWAYGFRNPWRISVDRKTGDLWVGDVGWELWELLDRVERGGNYGWSIMEGKQPTNPEWPRGPTPILPPTIERPHSESSSITDGLTYYGSRLKELHGHHLYGDYDTGKIWAFRYDQGRVLDHREIADTTHRIVGFGEDRDGEMYLLDHTAGTIHRLIPNPSGDQSADFPRKLSKTGLFESATQEKPAPGVVPYSINAELWSDHATAQRWVAVPGEASIKTGGTPAWAFPKDSVLVKTLSLEMQAGKPASRRRVETQLLHFDGMEWQTYTYQWNDEQTDALLVPAAGDERTLDVRDETAPGGVRRQTWRFAGRAECQRCHNKWAGPPLAFNTPQLNRVHDYSGTRAPQLETLAHVQLLDKPIPTEKRPTMAPPHDSAADLTARARSYLHANCAHCHRLHAGSSVLSKMPFDLPLEKTDMLNVRPTQGTFGIAGAQVIAPGDPYRSVLWYRMAKLGGGRMPHIGSTEVDQAGVRLIHDWIAQLPGEKEAENVARLKSEEKARVKELVAAESEAARAEGISKLLSSTSGALQLLHSIEDRSIPAPTASSVVAKASEHADPTIRDLFERFLPAEKRVKRLGSVIRPEQILALNGEPQRGQRLFFETAGVSCKNCHRINKQGTEIGPELTAIGKKYDRGQLLESLLEPSKRIDPQFVTYLAETDDGRLYTGLLVKKEAGEIVLKDAQNKEIRLAASEVERLVPQRQSLMPDLLLRDMTAEQVADLLAYLSSLK